MALEINNNYYNGSKNNPLLFLIRNKIFHAFWTETFCVVERGHIFRKNNNKYRIYHESFSGSLSIVFFQNLKLKKTFLTKKTLKRYFMQEGKMLIVSNRPMFTWFILGDDA